MKIGFCDDERSVLDVLCKYIDKYQVERRQIFEYRTFNNSIELLTEIEKGVCYDILFLDVLMPGENGIDVAREIRQYDSNVKIIFLTSSSEFAVESYTVGAYYYQLKPVQKESFFKLIDSVLALCEKENSESLIMRCKNGITRIELHHIEYCEVRHRTLFIHLITGQILESVGSLDELSKQLLLYGNFIRSHRSYLINLEHVQSLSYKSVTMNCRVEIPIPRGKYIDIKNGYLEYAFKSRKVML